MGKKVDEILDSIQESDGVKTRSQAIKIAKSQGMIKQSGGSLALNCGDKPTTNVQKSVRRKK